MRLDVIKNHERRHAGKLWNNQFGLVFYSTDRRSGLGHHLIEQMQNHCENAGLPKLTLHELRHTTPSLLLAMGVDQRVIMRCCAIRRLHSRQISIRTLRTRWFEAPSTSSMERFQADKLHLKPH